MKPFAIAGVITIVVACLGCAAVGLLVALKRPTPARVTAAEPSHPQDVVTRYSYLRFVDGRPDECIDMEATDRPGSTTNKDRMDALVPRMAGTTALRVTCAGQFPNRAVFASCEMDVDHVSDAGVSSRLRVKSSYFDYEILKGSQYAQDCIEARGTWVELPSDDRNVRHAEIEMLERQAAALQRSTGR